MARVVLCVKQAQQHEASRNIAGLSIFVYPKQQGRTPTQPYAKEL